MAEELGLGLERHLGCQQGEEAMQEVIVLQESISQVHRPAEVVRQYSEDQIPLTRQKEAHISTYRMVEVGGSRAAWIRIVFETCAIVRLERRTERIGITLAFWTEI
jgi:hypothetical protein